MTNKRQISAAFVLGGLLAVVVFAVMGTGAVAQQTGDSGGDTGDEFVRVTAGGATEAEADTVEVTLAVEARDDDPSAARQEVADGASDMRAALMGAGVSEDDIRSTGYTLREARRYERDEDVPRHYARQTFSVTLEDTGRAGEVIDTAVENGATTVSDVSFTVSDERRTQLKGDALETAMENARSQAEAVASSGGISVTSVRSVSTTDTDVSPVGLEYERLEASDGASTTLDPGPVEVEATVEVVYDVSS
jgi:uncharacterized protein YggE